MCPDNKISALIIFSVLINVLITTSALIIFSVLLITTSALIIISVLTVVYAS
jgi:hypothetical protein